MNSKTPSNSEIMNNVRNLAISRRGGVRTRGGKLSPINVRDLTAGNKKVVAPNIPQRRRIIKTENGSSEQLVVKSEKPTSFENSRGRGRGRQQRVFLQTEGSFLAEGPAARLKRDPASDGGISVPRVTRRSAKAGPDKNMDADAIRDLMDSYVAGEEYENVNEGKPPLRLPVQKDKVTCKIKLESDEDDKTKIKKEIIEDDKTKIKKEIIEDFETGVKREIKTEKDEDLAIADIVIKEETEYEKPTADSFLNIKDDGTLILLQLPVLSGSLKATDYEKDKAAKETVKEKDKKPAKENEPKSAPKFIDNFEEGFLGKLKIMKSGRMKLTLGSVEFELLDGTPSETYQEAASVKVGDGEGDITVLGKVEKKLILSPVISKLLREHVRNSKSLNFEE